MDKSIDIKNLNAALRFPGVACRRKYSLGALLADRKATSWLEQPNTGDNRE